MIAIEEFANRIDWCGQRLVFGIKAGWRISSYALSLSPALAVSTDLPTPLRLPLMGIPCGWVYNILIFRGLLVQRPVHSRIQARPSAGFEVQLKLGQGFPVVGILATPALLSQGKP